MFPLLTKHTAITAALLATLTLSACGKSKDEIVAPPQQAKVETKTAEQATDKKGTDTSGQLGAELPDPQSKSAPAAPKPGPVAKTPKVPVAPPAMPPIKQEAPAEKTPVAKGPVDKMPGTIVDVNKLAPQNNYKSSDASTSASRESVAKRFTGGTAKNGLFYTSSSTDTLMTVLKERNNRVDAATARLNLSAAASVVSAQLSVERVTKDVYVSLKIKEGSEVKNYVVAGTRVDGETTRLMKTSASGNAGGRALHGTMKCLDADGGCETTFVRLQIGSSGASAIINVVFRDSKANIHVNFPEELQSSSYEFLILKEFFMNAVKQAQHTSNKAKYGRMTSFEVVNGKSEATFSVVGLNNELIAFHAPLLSPRFGSAVDVSMAQVGSAVDSTVLNGSEASLKYASTIEGARMVQNNGLGKVSTVVKVRQTANQPAGQFELNFARIIKPVIELTDENMK